MNEKLIELLENYQEGDLVGAADIIDAAGTLDADDAAVAYRSVYEQIVDAFRASVQSGDASAIEAARDQWLADLRGPAEEGTEADDLAPLDNASGRLAAFADRVRRYEPGDLTAATEILTEARDLTKDPSTPEDVVATVRRIRDTFFDYVREGTLAEMVREQTDESPSQSDDRPEQTDESPPQIDLDPAPEAVGPSDQTVESAPAEQEPANDAAGEPNAEPADPHRGTAEEAPPHEVPVDDLDIVTSFIQESADHLDDIEHRVLNLEDDYSDDLVNSIFRSIHTIKGVASFVGFSYVSETSHELETLLDEVRNGRHEITDELITVLLHGTDVLSQIVQGIEAQVAAAGTTPPQSLVEESFGHLAIVLRVRELRGLVESTAASQPAPVATEATGADRQTSSAAEPAAAPDSGGRDLGDAPVVTRDMIDAFIEESTDLLDQVEQQLLAAETAPIPPDTVDRIFRSIHTVKGNAGFFWFSRVEQRCMTMEEALDTYRKAGAQLDHEAAGRFIDMLDTVRESVRAVESAVASTDAEGTDGGGGSERPGDEEQTDALGEILVQMGEIDEASLQRALERQQRRLGEILVTEEHVAPDSVEKALEEQAKRRTDSPAASAEYATTRKDIRVDTTKLDKLFELVGELITAESMVLGGLHGSNGNGSNGHGSYNGNGVNGSRSEGSTAIEKAASYLQKITREMQEITLSIRMIPLEATFGKMRRLVRDLARRFEKDVAIEISGEDTEMDKNVIEEISDPLVHIIRNAIDHGIETGDQREAAGKPRRGTIWLSAKHEGNEIWITVRDDGRGLNRERILAKAYDRGLVSEGDPDLTDEQVYRFIFEPAFSTADQVSEISGRGVGMDVVRQNIEKLRGKIDLKSDPGAGTTFILRIPLTLAILDGVTFSIAGTHYSIPTTDLVTFQGYDPARITSTSAQHHGFRLRDEVIPIIQYEHRDEPPEHGVIIVLQSNGSRAALLVDEIVGYRQFVVRSVPSYIKSMRAVSGCSIQGDGSISFIIDVAELMTEELESVGSR